MDLNFIRCFFDKYLFIGPPCIITMKCLYIHSLMENLKLNWLKILYVKQKQERIYTSVILLYLQYFPLWEERFF